MRTIIAGSRSIDDYLLVLKAVNQSKFHITEIVSGCANGVDKLGEQYAYEYDIPVKKFPADWDKYGKSAGCVRNVQMSENADALILIWDGISRGSKHMANIAKNKGLKVYIMNVMDDKKVNSENQIPDLD